MPLPRPLPFVLVLSLAACQAGGNGPQAQLQDKTESGTDAPATGSTRGERVITGNATYLERIQLPPESVLVVQLIDNQLADSPGAVLANVRLVNVRGPSIPFALPYDPADIDEDGDYGLHARLTNAAGRLLFVTDTRVAVDPGQREPVEFRMIHVGDHAALQPTHWQCGPLRVDARFNQSDNTVDLQFSGRKLQLPLAISGSGARYADEYGNEFWTKGNSGTLSLDGEKQPECVRTEQASPWTTAAERGVGFRAVGNEPGWWVEVDRGEAPALRALLDYGERKVEIAHVQPAGLGFNGETEDGTEVALEIAREPCQDDMSGERFEATARLTVGEDGYSGCGAFLAD